MNELLTTTLFNRSGQQVNQASWYYDAAGNQTGNTGYAGISNPLTITYNQHDQTASITDAYQHPVAMVPLFPVPRLRATAALSVTLAPSWRTVQICQERLVALEAGEITWCDLRVGVALALLPLRRPKPGLIRFDGSQEHTPIGDREGYGFPWLRVRRFTNVARNHDPTVSAKSRGTPDHLRCLRPAHRI